MAALTRALTTLSPCRSASGMHHVLLRRLVAAHAYARPRRLHGLLAAASAAPGAAAPAEAMPAVAPPPTVPWEADAANSVALSGTVLTDPQVRYFPANQVAAHVRMSLAPRIARPDLPQQPQGAVTVDARGALALQLAEHVHKGSRIQVRGMLREDAWTDKATGDRRYALKVLAEELSLLAPHAADQHAALQATQQTVQPHAQAQQVEMAVPAAAQQQQQQQPPPSPPAQQQQQQQQRQQGAAPVRPQASHSAEVSRQMYEEGAALGAVAASRGIKLSTVVSHLVETVAAGTLASVGRLSADLGLGPEGGAKLSPAEVAAAIADASGGDMDLQRVPLKAIRAQLEANPAAGAKAAQLVSQCGGDPALLYGAIKLVMAALEWGIPFSAVSGGLAGKS